MDERREEKDTAGKSDNRRLAGKNAKGTEFSSVPYPPVTEGLNRLLVLHHFLADAVPAFLDLAQ